MASHRSIAIKCLIVVIVTCLYLEYIGMNYLGMNPIFMAAYILFHSKG